MRYTQSTAPAIQPIDSLVASKIGGDGLLFTIMLAAVAGIFFFKNKSKQTENFSERIDLTTLKVQSKKTESIETSQVFCPDYAKTGHQIIDELVNTKLSTLLAAPSGAGKSVTQAYWLTKLFEKFPYTDAYVIARKNDSFNGLREEGKVTVYNSANPQLMIDTINKIYEVFKVRSQMPEGKQRDDLRNKPVRLILADWYSTHNSLIKSYKKLWETEIQTKLADIVTVGREFNVSLFADSQTYNIASLGLAEDSNIRNNLNIISQGLISFDESGLEQGGFEVMQSIIRSSYIFPDEKLRLKFATDFSILIEASNQQHIPAILSTAGKPKAGLLQNLVEYKSQAIKFSVIE